MKNLARIGETVWVEHIFNPGDIVKINPTLEKTQPYLFPRAGLCVVLKTFEKIYHDDYNKSHLYVFSKHRGKFMIDSEHCILVLKL